ncbi:hypothetical protein A6A40_15515 (plasmid) [Azospirillum humicireducens]|uniref:Uncharacterized protein n=1 Tax=Azospirillum humicireducens TaxID=1226968 RepID=A0A2R4VPZ6_9PROT|nr:hypothetical protein [Azospirillum humicireducens]AWB06501.1 hypothetical protein A6A40_15515 [Azospirillum humicireducens]
MMETLVVGLIVALAFAWVAWTILLPSAARDRLRRLAGRTAPPSPAGGCGGGCCGCTAAGPNTARHHGGSCGSH